MLKNRQGFPLLTIGATLLLAIPFHIRSRNFIVDDGFFYPQVARFIAHGHGSTFNGWMPTNGYHPLWMMVCVVAAKITMRSTPLLQLLGAIQDLLILGSVLVLSCFSEAAKKRGTFAGVASLLFMSMVLGIWRMLETDLSLALQFAALAIAVPIFPELQARLGKWRNVVLGCLLGLTMLSRLDLLFFAAIILCYQLLSQTETLSTSYRVRQSIVQGAIAGLCVTPYLLWNYTRFHHLEPISGAIKNTFPHMQLHIDHSIVGILVPTAILLALPLLFKKNRTYFDQITLLAAAGAALHYIFTISFGSMAPWYPTTGFICLAMVLIIWSDILLSRLGASRRLELAASVCLLLLMGALAGIRTKSNLSMTRILMGRVSLHNAYVQPGFALAMRLRETLPPNSRIFVYDAPGAIAYYSGMSVLPADGLMANYAFNEDIVSAGFSAYANEHGIDYVIAPYVRTGQISYGGYLKVQRIEGGQTMDFNAPLTHKDAGTVTLPDTDLLFRAGTATPDLESTFPEVGVWRLAHH